MADHQKKIKDIVKQVQKAYDNAKPLTATDKADRILVHPVYGLIVFFLVMWAVFSLSQTYVGPFLSGLLEMGMAFIGDYIESGLNLINASELFKGFILEGLWGGFTAVLGFLPLIMVLFFLLQLLEDSGYMMRVSMLLDRYFSAIGLGGRSSIPMFVGLACSVPAVMASRTIEDEKQRKLTVILTPFVPCGAKLPVIVLLLGVFFSDYAWMTSLMYLSAILLVFIVGFFLKIFLNVSSDHQKAVYDLPDYKTPSLEFGVRMMIAQAKTFIKSAGTIIVVLNGLVWFFVSFNFSLVSVAPDESMLRTLAIPFEWLLTPIGITSWGLAVAAILGFIAKEEIVGALAVIYVFSVSDAFSVINMNETREVLTQAASLTAVTALSYTAFNLFSPPCFATIGAMNTEFSSNKWLIFAVVLQLFTGFLVAVLIYQIGTLITTGLPGQGFIFSSLLVFGTFLSLIIASIYHRPKKRLK
jgi:ferrous iron transport protein B